MYSLILKKIKPFVEGSIKTGELKAEFDEVSKGSSTVNKDQFQQGMSIRLFIFIFLLLYIFNLLFSVISSSIKYVYDKIN